MPDVPMTLTQPSGATVQIEMPDDATMSDLMPDFITSLGLPASGSDGVPVTYRIHAKHLGRELNPNETLQGAGVPSGTSLLIAPHAVAGTGTADVAVAG